MAHGKLQSSCTFDCCLFNNLQASFINVQLCCVCLAAYRGIHVMPEESKAVSSPCQVEALKRCLEEHNGDHSRCRKEVEAFSASCGAPKAQARKTTS